MNAHEHTDPHGDGLTITHDNGKVWITCTSKHTEVTVGPLPADALDTRPCPDVDAHWRIDETRDAYLAATRHAEKAEHERDEARKFATAEHVRATDAKRARDEWADACEALGRDHLRLRRALDLPDTATTDGMVARIEEINAGARPGWIDALAIHAWHKDDLRAEYGVRAPEDGAA